MVRLGDAFSPQQKQSAYDATLVAGSILHLNQCRFVTPPKAKFVVLVGRDEDVCLLFLINSEPRHRPHQVRLRDLEYAFLTHDSYMNCSEAIDVLTATDIAAELAQGSAQYVGDLTADTIEEVLKETQQARTLTGFHKKIIYDALSAQRPMDGTDTVQPPASQ